MAAPFELSAAGDTTKPRDPPCSQDPHSDTDDLDPEFEQVEARKSDD